MKRLLAWAAALCLLLTAGSARAELTAGQIREADAYFQKLYEERKIFNGAVIVNRDGERIYDFYYGIEDRQHGIPITADTVYRMASVTKLITAVGLMRLVEEGKIGLDEPLVGPTGAPIRNPLHPHRDITLRQVMSHTSSILADAPYEWAPPWDKIQGEDNKYFRRSAPGTRYEYANLNGGILGSVIEQLSGQNLNDYMTESLFSPLGINAAYAAHLLPDTDRLAGVSTDNGTIRVGAAGLMQQDAERFDPSCDPFSHYSLSVGRLYISLAGLEKIGVALAGDGTVDGYRVLNEETIALMRQDQSTVEGSSVFAKSPYGLCTYRHTTPGGVTWYGHQGRYDGIMTELFCEPKTHTVIVFVTNGSPPISKAGEISQRMEDVMSLVEAWLP